MSSVVVVLSLGLFAGAGLLSTSTQAFGAAGSPEVLRDNCSWEDKERLIQTCEVWSAAHGKPMLVQIRASNGSSQGIYLLDGMRAGEETSGWTHQVNAADVYDSSTDTTLVMPVGGASSFNTDWEGGAGDQNVVFMQETWLTEELPLYLEEHFGVSPSNNALIGFSMSAGPAVTLAEKHPEQFKVVQAMSGYYQIDNPIGYLGVFATQTIASNYTNGILNMWGLPGTERWRENDPSKNVSKLKENGQVLIISSGNAFLTPSERASMSEFDQIISVFLEAVSAVSTVLMQLQAKVAGVDVVVIPSYGGHTWENWERMLPSGREKILETLRNNEPVTTTTQLVTEEGHLAPGAAKDLTEALVVAAKAEPTLPDVDDALDSTETSTATTESATQDPTSAASAPVDTTAPSTPGAPSSAAESTESAEAVPSSGAAESAAPSGGASAVPSATPAGESASADETAVPAASN